MVESNASVQSRLGDLRAELRLYRVLIGARTRSELTYRSSFIIRVISSFVVTSLDFVSIVALLSKVRTLGDWTTAQVAFLYGVSSVSFRVMDLFIGGVESASEMVRSGGFDRYLVRPIGSLTQLMGDFFNVRRAAALVQGLAVLVWSLTQLPIVWSIAKVLFLSLAIVGGALISAAIFVTTCSFSFWSPNTSEFSNAFNYGGNTLAEYPIHIMKDWIRGIAFTLVPVGFVAYLPSFVLFDPPNPLGVPRWLSYVSPLVCVPLLALAAAVWRAAVRHYTSTGS